MRTATLRNALRATAQLGNPTRVHYRSVHQDASNSPHQKNVKPAPNVREYAQSAPINISHFKALLQSPGELPRKRYRLRWDWHLRNFLTALVPPAALWLLIQLVKWRHGGNVEEYAHLLPTDHISKDWKTGTAAQSDKQHPRKGPMASLEARLMERVERLEKEMDQLRSQRSAPTNSSTGGGKVTNGGDRETLLKARQISRTMVRGARDTG